MMLALQEVIARIGVGATRILYLVTSAILVAMASLLFIQVAFRYGLKTSLPWSEEVARFLLCWFSLLSSCVAAHLGQHFTFSSIVSRLPGVIQAPLGVTVLLINTVAVGGLAVYCFQYLDNLQGLYATATDMDMRIAYACLPVSFGLLSLMFAAEFADTVLGFFTGRRFTKWPQPDVEQSFNLAGVETLSK